MEKIPESNKENHLNILEDLILRVAESIEEEYLRTPNTWIVCLKGHVFALESHLYFVKKKGYISIDQYEILHKKIENLKLKTSLLAKEYPNKETIPPDYIKQELLNDFNILK